MPESKLPAQAVGAILAFERVVACVGKAFGMGIDLHLPNDVNDDRQARQRPGVYPGDEQKRREHHKMIPVEDTAGGAAAILHKPNAKRTPEQHADQITHVKRCNEQHGKPIRAQGF